MYDIEREVVEFLSQYPRLEQLLSRYLQFRIRQLSPLAKNDNHGAK